MQWCKKNTNPGRLQGTTSLIAHGTARCKDQAGKMRAKLLSPCKRCMHLWYSFIYSFHVGTASASESTWPRGKSFPFLQPLNISMSTAHIFAPEQEQRERKEEELRRKRDEEFRFEKDLDGFSQSSTRSFHSNSPEYASSIFFLCCYPCYPHRKWGKKGDWPESFERLRTDRMGTRGNRVVIWMNQIWLSFCLLFHFVCICMF